MTVNGHGQKVLCAGYLALLCGSLAAVMICLWGCFFLALVWRGQPVDRAAFFRLQSSPELRARDGTTLFVYLNSEAQWAFPVSPGRISPRLTEATIAAEDKRFWRHPGVDPIAVCRAALQNLRHGRIFSGASTLTMQAVKLAEGDDRSFSGKCRQMLRALQIERHASKEDILAYYLNRAPYGYNLTGVEAASRRYFGKPAAELLLHEAALIAGLPRAPSDYQPLAQPDRARGRRNHVLDRMLEEGFISAEAHAAAIQRPLDAAWHDFPACAPHLAMQFEPDTNAGNSIETTLDAAIQAMALRECREHIKRFDGAITNAAAMVVDVETREVLARIGSADFHHPEGGQVDLTRAPRSPGSTLKPFTYALAIENNRLYPEEILLDDTLDYGTYNPENFNGIYNGLIPAGDALHYSLNVPAVAILERIGPEKLHRFLRECGLTTLVHAPEHYGLGLTLGNCEARMDEVCAAYAMIAALGEYRPLRILRQNEDGSRDSGARTDTDLYFRKRLLHKGTAMALYRMLEAPFPNEINDSLIRPGGAPPRVCWKTGTSTGCHDAWAFVFNRQYVIGVWMGNSNGRPSRRLVGASAALPLAARIFRRLPPKTRAPWPQHGGHLREIQVCAVSGLPAGRWCNASRAAYFPEHQFLNRRCDMHHPGEREGIIVERWPATARGWDLARIRNAVEIARNPGTGTRLARKKPDSPVTMAEPLRITAPAHNTEFIYTGGAKGGRIQLEASLADSELHWYLNDRHIGASGPEAPLYLKLEPGAHKLVCLGPGGATASVRFKVESPFARAVG
jgi:penicillin-binding protein 1C